MKKIFVVVLSLLMLFSMNACFVIEGDTIQPNEVISETTEAQNLVKEQVLLDQGDIKITCKGFQYAGDFDLGPALKLAVANNSDQDITIQVREVSVNGYMTDPICSIDVASNKKANDKITWMNSELEENEITNFESIEFYFHIFTTDGYDLIFDSEMIMVNFN